MADEFSMTNKIISKYFPHFFCYLNKRYYNIHFGTNILNAKKF